MVSKHARVRDASIVASDAAAALDHYVPDLANWPRSWSIEEADVAIGRSIVDALQPFLTDLLTRQLADRTLRRHRDHLWMLGGEIIRRGGVHLLAPDAVARAPLPPSMAAIRFPKTSVVGFMSQV